MPEQQKRYPHIFLKQAPDTTQFTSPQGGSSKINLPPGNRESHSQKLRLALDIAWRQARQFSQHRQAVAHPTRDGVYLEFQGKAGYDLVTKSLEDRRYKIRLLNVRQEKDATIRTFWMPVVNNQGRFGRCTFIEISDP